MARKSAPDPIEAPPSEPKPTQATPNATATPSYEYLSGIIDVSHWEYDAQHGRIASALLEARDAGVVAVIAKATQGKDGSDASFPAWVDACAKLGLLFGAYHFGSNTEDGDKQADWFFKHVAAAGCDPMRTALMLDFERDPEPSLTMTLEQARAFAERVKEVRGWAPLLYGDTSFLGQIIEPDDAIGMCPLFPAMYGGSMAPGHGPKVPPAWAKRGWTLWQYTDGTYGAMGLPMHTHGFGGIDRSVFKGSLEQLRAAWPRF